VEQFDAGQNRVLVTTDVMARGLDEEEATSVIVRGFLEADIEGLPTALQKKLDEVIEQTSKDLL
jgi:Fe-S cluster assembly scaffold protein SufB